MSKFSLINVANDFNLNFNEGDVIEFKIPPFTGDEYKAIIKRDENFGLYIDEDDNYFHGCEDFIITRDGMEI